MKEKLSILTELIKLARCDHKVREEEFDFLLSISRSLGVEDDAFNNLFDEYIEFTPPESEFDRILQFQRLVLLMNVDELRPEAELKFLKDTGIRMGLNPNATNRVLKEMHHYPNRVIPPERLIEIFKENYN